MGKLIGNTNVESTEEVTTSSTETYDPSRMCGIFVQVLALARFT